MEGLYSTALLPIFIKKLQFLVPCTTKYSKNVVLRKSDKILEIFQLNLEFSLFIYDKKCTRGLNEMALSDFKVSIILHI